MILLQAGLEMDAVIQMKIDHGVHTVCAKVTTKFLEWAKIAGNDLITPHPRI